MQNADYQSIYHIIIYIGARSWYNNKYGRLETISGSFYESSHCFYLGICMVISVPLGSSSLDTVAGTPARRTSSSA